MRMGRRFGVGDLIGMVGWLRRGACRIVRGGRYE